MFSDLFQHKETFFPLMKKDFKLPYKIILFIILGLSWVINIYRNI